MSTKDREINAKSRTQFCVFNQDKNKKVTKKLPKLPSYRKVTESYRKKVTDGQLGEAVKSYRKVCNVFVLSIYPATLEWR